MSIRPVLTRVLPATFLAVLVLAGCAAGGTGADPHLAAPRPMDPQPLLPSGEATFLGKVDDMGTEPAATLDGEGNIVLVTYGSSSCPPVVANVEATSESTIAVDLDASAEGPCTADIAPTTHIIALPDGATQRPLTIQINYINEPWEFTISVP